MPIRNGKDTFIQYFNWQFYFKTFSFGVGLHFFQRINQGNRGTQLPFAVCYLRCKTVYSEGIAKIFY